MTTPDGDDLETRAKDYVEKLPGETALGNPDAAGGSQDDPKTRDESGPRGSQA